MCSSRPPMMLQSNRGLEQVVFASQCRWMLEISERVSAVILQEGALLPGNGLFRRQANWFLCQPVSTIPAISESNHESCQGHFMTDGAPTC